MTLTHQDRKARREKIAQECLKLLCDGNTKTYAYTQVASYYGVCATTVIKACVEFNIDSQIPEVIEKPVEQVKELNPNTAQILNLLNTDLTYREIAEQMGCTKQNVQIVHSRFLALGYDLPTRSEVLERKLIRKQEQQNQREKDFVAKYEETNNLEESASAFSIPINRAKDSQKYRLNGNGLIIDKNLCEQYPSQRITRRWLYIMSDLLQGGMTATMIAEKWKKPVPFVFNLIAECKSAGILLPELPDGRLNARRAQPVKHNTCKTCGKVFKPSFRDEQGDYVRGNPNRVQCFDCEPFKARGSEAKIAEETKIGADNDL